MNLSQTTGTFRGGASGALYGLSDDGVPAQAVLDGARVTNISQKPPGGAQHPNGDALAVEKEFFASGQKDIYVYVQDEYPDWPYNKGVRPGSTNGVWDYLPHPPGRRRQDRNHVRAPGRLHLHPVQRARRR